MQTTIPNTSPLSKAQWEELRRRAQSVEDAINNLRSQLLLDAAEISDSDETLAITLIDAAKNLPSFSAYFYVPQSEWTGGETWKVREPHIAGRRCSARPEVL
jgi:hypothetical protein